jgi:hypothetical protein
VLPWGVANGISNIHREPWFSLRGLLGGSGSEAIWSNLKCAKAASAWLNRTWPTRRGLESANSVGGKGGWALVGPPR